MPITLKTRHHQSNQVRAEQEAAKRQRDGIFELDGPDYVTVRLQKWATGGFQSYLEHLPDFLLGQIDVELVEQLVNLSDAQGAVSVFVGLGERLLQPRDAAVKAEHADLSVG